MVFILPELLCSVSLMSIFTKYSRQMLSGGTTYTLRGHFVFLNRLHILIFQIFSSPDMLGLSIKFEKLANITMKQKQKNIMS